MSDFSGVKEIKNGVAVHGDDKALWVEFRREAKQNMAKSEQAGRPIFDEFDYIHITVPGGKTKVIEKVNDGHKQRFPDHWRLHQEKMNGRTGEALIGTPLDQWPAMSLSQTYELRALGIHTVDQLAHLTEAGIAAIGLGGRELKAKAAAFLAQATNNSEVEALAADNLHLSEEVERLNKTVQELSAKIMAMSQAAMRPALPDPVAPYQPQVLEHAEPPEFVPMTGLTEDVQVAIPERRRGRPPKAG